MGGPSSQDLSRHLISPASPPQLLSPTASTYSSRSTPSAEHAWERSSRTPAPMASYEKRPPVLDVSVDRNIEQNQGRTASSDSSTPRQQLPSLSSLFGPPSTGRPPNTPLSERAGPYTPGSLVDRLGVSSSDSNQQPSYFPATVSPPLSQARGGFEADRQPFQSHFRTFSNSESPRFRDISQGRSDSRSDVEASARWTLQQETARSEYTVGPHEASRDQCRIQFREHKTPGAGYPEQTSPRHAAIPPPTPASTAMTESLTGKDGLGPKIWTGTHFLPRFVRAAEVAGEGLCYFYDDGSHCKTVIDGEAVNAHWGVTKAGKPRKRLAIACVTCREKKIKCDPDYPRCVQCEKFGRVCRFKNAPRGGHNGSPSTPPDELDGGPKINGTRADELRLSESEPRTQLLPRSVGGMGSPEAVPQKRFKLEHGGFIASGEPISGLPLSLDHSKSQLVMARPSPEATRIPNDVLTRAWKTDPYSSDPQSVMNAVSQFFALADSSMILRFLPETLFKTWLADPSHKKSAEDLMLLYSVLAVGVALSGGPKHIAFEYAQVAHHAQKTSAVNCLQLAQSRILLGMYYVSTSKLCESNELMSGAAGTMACIQLNFELEKSREAGLPVYPFGMSKSTYSEARRRTFWSLYMLERLNGMFPNRLAFINAEDIHTRLPGDLPSFEKQLVTHMPAFDPYELNTPKLSEQPTDIGPYIVEMVNIWANSQAGVYRLARRPISSEVETAKVQALAKRVQEWHASLPACYTFSTENLESAASSNHAGSFVMMHVLYHHAMMKLNRHRQYANQLVPEARGNLYEQCCHHAANIIDKLRRIDEAMKARPWMMRYAPPVVAVAAWEAVDVLTAAGSRSHISHMIEDVRVAKQFIDSVAQIWGESEKHKADVEQRLEKLNRIREQGSRPSSPVDGFRMIWTHDKQVDDKDPRWQISEPFEKLYPKDIDIVYLLA